jgi:hypothetical protein
MPRQISDLGFNLIASAAGQRTMHLGARARLRIWASCFALLALSIPTSPSAVAQMVQASLPVSSYAHSAYEHFGTSFGWAIPGGVGPGSRVVGLLPNGMLTPGGYLQFGQLQQGQGGWGGVMPPFGGYDPNANARFGFGIQGPQGGFRLGLELGQGSTRTITSLTPSLTVQNGGGGYIMSGSSTPFVTGWIPMVGAASGPAPLDNAVTRAVQSGQLRLDNLGDDLAPDSTAPSEREVGAKPSSAVGSAGRSTAETATESVAAIRSRKAAEQAALAEEIALQLQEYERHRSAGQVDLARLALNRAVVLERDPERKQKLRALLKSTR